MNIYKTALHVINHTHWDREWFVPYTFTRSWIPGLIENLDKVVTSNPQYKFLFDGQTMVIEDLEAIDKKVYAAACRLIRNKNLAIGPYFAQIDMRMSGSESLIRNLRIGIDKTKELGGATDFTAWGVDIFGHVSQSPQIHGLFGIANAYMWRGPDRLEPFFWWKGADGTTMLAVDLFAGGYRNFYRVTTKARLALPRLEHEVRKLSPYYKQGHIPVFDGYDLDSDPGDAAAYFATNHVDHLTRRGIQVVNSSPLQFAEEIRELVTGLPTLSGELISGKYSSVFPGTLSARVYSKLLAGHAERLLYRYAEPLSSLLPANEYPEKLFEDQTKLILQNLVHDVIAGCSIDQVHQIAEMRAEKLDKTLKAKTAETIMTLAGLLENGTYAYLPASGETRLRFAHDSKLYKIAGKGVSIAKVTEVSELPSTTRKVSEFSWKNDYFESTLHSDGSIELGSDNSRFGQLVVRKEEGDTYWDEPRGETVPLTIQGPIMVGSETDEFAQVSFTAIAQATEHSVKALVTLTFDDSPLVKWQVKLSTTGTGFSVLMRHSYDAPLSKLNVGMQFDNVERKFLDTNLLGRNLEPALMAFLNDSGQRDLYQTFTFPFHSYISPVLPANRVHLLAKSLRAYQTEQPGHVDLVLSRAVDWLMKPSHHEYHSGDAGPKFYVPDARSQRETTIDCAILVSATGPDDITFHQAVDQYMCAPLLFEVKKSSGKQSRLSLFDESAAIISSLHQYKGKRLARIYNPTLESLPLSHEHPTLDQDNNDGTPIAVLTPKAIATISLEPVGNAKTTSLAQTTILNWPEYPVGPDSSSPDPVMVAELTSMYERLQQEIDSLTISLKEYDEDAPHSLQHLYYVVARECMEARLSLLWNKRRTEQPAVLTEDYAAADADKELQTLATQYNDLRVMRRMYDYIVGIDAKDQPIARPATHHASQTTPPVDNLSSVGEVDLDIAS